METFGSLVLPQQQVLHAHLKLYTARLGDIINPTAYLFLDI